MSHKDAKDVDGKVVDEFLEDNESGMPPSKPKKAPAPRQPAPADVNYSEEMYKDEEEKEPSIEEISQPTELGDREDAEDLQREADEVKARLEAEKRMEKAKGRHKNQIKRNGTRIMGTKRYNPFLFGSVGSLVSGLGSNFETKKKVDLRKALYADDPLQLYLRKGWYKLLTKDDMVDNESVFSGQNEKRKNKVFKFLSSNKKNKNRQYQVNNKSTLTPVQIRAINSIARKSNMEDLSPDEVEMIEDKLNAEKPSGPAGCFNFIKNCFNMIASKREEGEDKNRRKTGDTDLSISPSEVQENIQRRAMVKSNRPSTKKRLTTAMKGDCIFCHKAIKPSESLKVAEGNPEDEPVCVECVKCELCRVRVTKVSALKRREAGKPSLCNRCVINVEQSKEAQSQLHSGDVVRSSQYLPLVPQGCKLFLPLQIVGINGDPAVGMVGMCTHTGIQLRKRDMPQVRQNGPELLLSVTPTKDKLRTTFRADMKIAAAGFGKEISMRITASSGLLKDPLGETFVFKRDESSLQYDLRQSVKTNLGVAYYVSSKETKSFLNLQNLRAESLIFAGTLTEDIGPFLSGHKVVVQEEDLSATGKNVYLRGRYEHGILYEWAVTLLLDSEGSSLTPVRLDLTLRLPQL